MTPLKVLITGANGNLAPFVIARLRDRYQLTLTSGSEPSKTNRDIPFIKADLADYEKVVKSLEGQDVVIHMSSTTVLNCRRRPLRMQWSRGLGILPKAASDRASGG